MTTLALNYAFKRKYNLQRQEDNVNRIKKKKKLNKWGRTKIFLTTEEVEKKRKQGHNGHIQTLADRYINPVGKSM